MGEGKSRRTPSRPSIDMSILVAVNQLRHAPGIPEKEWPEVSQTAFCQKETATSFNETHYSTIFNHSKSSKILPRKIVTPPIGISQSSIWQNTSLPGAKPPRPAPGPGRPWTYEGRSVEGQQDEGHRRRPRPGQPGHGGHGGSEGMSRSREKHPKYPKIWICDWEIYGK